MKSVTTILSIMIVGSTLTFIGCHRSGSPAQNASQTPSLDPHAGEISALMLPVCQAVFAARWEGSVAAMREAEYRAKGANPPASVIESRTAMEEKASFIAPEDVDLRSAAKTWLTEQEFLYLSAKTAAEKDIKSISEPAKRLHIAPHVEKPTARLAAAVNVLTKIEAAKAALLALEPHK